MRTDITLSQDQPINPSGILFATKAEKILPILVDGIRRGDDLLRHFSSREFEVYHALDYLIMNYHQTDSGRITTSMICDAIRKVGESYEMAQLFSWDWEVYQKLRVQYPDDSEVFAIGVLDQDYEDGDPDCYQTAGGYRVWKALAGSKVEYKMNADLSVRAVFESNCVKDHYNNNFFGSSTGGGTTQYKTGERVEKRSVIMRREFIDYDWSKPKFKATITEIDIEKARRLVVKFIPEFNFLFEKK